MVAVLIILLLLFLRKPLPPPKARPQRIQSVNQIAAPFPSPGYLVITNAGAAANEYPSVPSR